MASLGCCFPWLAMKKNPHAAKRRYMVLVLFGLYSTANAMQWLTYGPVQAQSKYYFNLTTSELNNLSTVYMWIYMSLAVFSCIGLEKIGLRWCLLIGTGLNFLGSMLKVVLGFPADNFIKNFMAQFLNSLSQIFVLSIPPILATVWFPEQERATATAIGTVFNAMGSALGMLIPPLIVKDDSESAGMEVTGQRFLKLFIMQAALCGAAFFGVVFLVPYESFGGDESGGGAVGDSSNVRAPLLGGGGVAVGGGNADNLHAINASGVSLDTVNAARVQGHNDDEDDQPQQQSQSVVGVVIAIFRLLKDVNFTILLAALCISVGSVWTINSFLSQLLASINISEGDAGQMGFWNILAGTIVAVAAGPVVDKFRVYKWPVVGLALFQLLCLSMIIMIIYLDETAIGDPVKPASRLAMYAVVVINGIPQNVITPIGFEYLMEQSHGHLDSLSGGLLMSIANVISFVLVSAGSVLLGDDTVAPKANTLNCLWMIWGMCCLGCALMVIPKNRLKRYEAQKAAAAAAVTAAAVANSGAAVSDGVESKTQ